MNNSNSDNNNTAHISNKIVCTACTGGAALPAQPACTAVRCVQAKHGTPNPPLAETLQPLRDESTPTFPCVPPIS